MSSYFKDPDFQRKLVAFLCKDRNFLSKCGPLLEADDFKPKKDESPEIWIIASKALEFWRKYHEPIGGMLRTEMLSHASQFHLSEKQRVKLLDLVTEIKKGDGLVAVEALEEKVIQYKKDRTKARMLQTLLDLQSAGKLTDEKLFETCMEGVKQFGQNNYEPVDYFEGLDERMARRIMSLRKKPPLFLIDGLDEKVQGVGRGQVGLLLAYYKMGKSLGLQHIALACVLQGYNVLYITLEDGMDIIEDRFDAAVSSLPLKKLNELPKRLRKKYERFRLILRSKLKIIDGTEGGMSIAKMEEIWERERNRAFHADVVIVDYDDEVVPPKKHQGESSRRMEFADIYRSFRQFISRKKAIGWIAAQASKKAEGKKIVTGGMAAEDVSKLRKVTMCITIGQGEWGEDSRYLHVAAHKTDRQHVGCHIISNPDKAIFYDRDATLHRERIETRKSKQKNAADDE